MQRNRYWLVEVEGTNVAMAQTRADAEAFIQAEGIEGATIKPTKEFTPGETRRKRGPGRRV